VSVCRGEVVNGGFGLVLDGTVEAERRAKLMLSWDVNNGVRITSVYIFVTSDVPSTRTTRVLKLLQQLGLKRA